MRFIWDRYRTKVKFEKEKGSCSMLMEDYTKVTGIKTYDMGKDTRGTRQVTSIEVSLKMGKLTDEEFTNGEMEKCMMETGTRE